MKNFRQLSLDETSILFGDHIIDEVQYNTPDDKIAYILNDLKCLAHFKELQLSDKTESLIIDYRAYLIDEKSKSNA